MSLLNCRRQNNSETLLISCCSENFFFSEFFFREVEALFRRLEAIKPTLEISVGNGRLWVWEGLGEEIVSEEEEEAHFYFSPHLSQG